MNNTKFPVSHIIPKTGTESTRLPVICSGEAYLCIFLYLVEKFRFYHTFLRFTARLYHKRFSKSKKYVIINY